MSDTVAKRGLSGRIIAFLLAFFRSPKFVEAVRRVAAGRMLPIFLGGLLIYNPFTWSYYGWATHRWNEGSMFAFGSLADPSWQSFWLVLFWLGAALLAWVVWYLVKTAYTNMGGISLSLAFSLLVTAGIIGIYYTLGGAMSGPWFEMFIILVAAVYIGYGVSASLLHRLFTGQNTMANPSHTDHHGPHDGEDHHHDGGAPH